MRRPDTDASGHAAMPNPKGASPPPESRTGIRVVVVDDHPIFRKGLVDVINDEPGMCVCGEAGTIAAALAAVVQHQPHVAIVDLSLGDESGLDLVSSIRDQHPSVAALVLSGHDERLYADRALKAGARGYIMKDQASKELIAAIRRVSSGKAYVSADAADRILQTLGGAARASASPLERLSDRERHVLALIGRGLATREIAERLALSVKTVESHCAHIKDKLGLRNARELTRLAVTLTDGQAL